MRVCNVLMRVLNLLIWASYAVELLPLGCIQESVTPLLECPGSRVVERELVPGGEQGVLVRLGGLAELRPHPPVYHGNIGIGNLVTGSWPTAPSL